MFPAWVSSMLYSRFPLLRSVADRALRHADVVGEDLGLPVDGYPDPSIAHARRQGNTRPDMGTASVVRQSRWRAVTDDV